MFGRQNAATSSGSFQYIRVYEYMKNKLVETNNESLVKYKFSFIYYIIYLYILQHRFEKYRVCRFSYYLAR